MAEYTGRGFRVFDCVPCRRGLLRVQESSLADNGPHVWLFLEGPGLAADESPQLDVAGALRLSAALLGFALAALAGELTEEVSGQG